MQRRKDRLLMLLWRHVQHPNLPRFPKPQSVKAATRRLRLEGITSLPRYKPHKIIRTIRGVYLYTTAQLFRPLPAVVAPTNNPTASTTDRLCILSQNGNLLLRAGFYTPTGNIIRYENLEQGDILLGKDGSPVTVTDVQRVVGGAEYALEMPRHKVLIRCPGAIKLTMMIGFAPTVTRDKKDTYVVMCPSFNEQGKKVVSYRTVARYQTQEEAKVAAAQVAPHPPVVVPLKRFLALDKCTEFKLTARVAQVPHPLDHTRSILKSIIEGALSTRLTQKQVLNTIYILGLWLADGYAGQATIKQCMVDLEGRDHTPICLALVNWYVELYNKLPSALVSHNVAANGALLNSLAIGLNRADRGRALGNYGFTTLIKRLNLFKNKHVPQILITEKLEYRQAFLAGYLDGDGCLQDNSWVFESTTPALVHGIHQLALSVGLVPGSLKRLSRAGNIFYSGNCSGDQMVNVARFMRLSWKKNIIVTTQSTGRTITWRKVTGAEDAAVKVTTDRDVHVLMEGGLWVKFD